MGPQTWGRNTLSGERAGVPSECVSQCYRLKAQPQTNKFERGARAKVWGGDGQGCRTVKGASSGDAGDWNCIRLHVSFSVDDILGHLGDRLLTLQPQAQDVLLPLSAEQGLLRTEVTRPVVS